MTEEETIALPIKHIKETTYQDGSVSIEFEIDNFPFSMRASIFVDHRLLISRIHHEAEDRKCPVCRLQDTRFCEVLNQQHKKVFQQLIASNSLRLPWLFRSYRFA